MKDWSALSAVEAEEIWPDFCPPAFQAVYLISQCDKSGRSHTYITHAPLWQPTGYPPTVASSYLFVLLSAGSFVFSAVLQWAFLGCAEFTTHSKPLLINMGDWKGLHSEYFNGLGSTLQDNSGWIRLG